MTGAENFRCSLVAVYSLNFQHRIKSPLQVLKYDEWRDAFNNLSPVNDSNNLSTPKGLCLQRRKKKKRLHHCMMPLHARTLTQPPLHCNSHRNMSENLLSRFHDQARPGMRRARFFFFFFSQRQKSGPQGDGVHSAVTGPSSYPYI